MRNDKRGMTLIEVIVVLLIVTILLGAIYMVLDVSISTLFKEDSRVEIQESMRMASLSIEQDFRQSNQTSIPEEVDGCYYINLQEYCLDSSLKALSRNSVVLVNKIEAFTISEVDGQAHIVLTSVDDKYGKNIVIETNVTLRGKRDENKLPESNP